MIEQGVLTLLHRKHGWLATSVKVRSALIIVVGRK